MLQVLDCIYVLIGEKCEFVLTGMYFVMNGALRLRIKVELVHRPGTINESHPKLDQIQH